MIKICEYCGREFNSKGHTKQKCCNKSCAMRLRRKEDIGVFGRDDVDDSIKKYILGLTITDGCIRENKTSLTKTICISLKDKYMIQQICDLVCPTKRIYKDGANWQVVWRNSWDIEYLKELGIEMRKTYNVTLPNVSNMWHMIRGIIDGDGSVSICNIYDKKSNRDYKYNRISIVTGSKQMKDDLVDFFHKNGFTPIIIKDKRHVSTYCIAFNRQKEILEMKKLIYKNAGKWKLERKYQKFL